MTKARIPSWWLSVGAEEARRMEQLFATVMAELPISHAALADRLDVSPSTVTRWANGRVTPSPEVMLAAVAEADEELKRRVERATQARRAVTELVAADQAEADGPFGAGKAHRKKLKELLDELGIELED